MRICVFLFTGMEKKYAGQKPAAEEVRATSHKARASDTCGNMKYSHDAGVHVQTNFGKNLTRSERTSEPIGNNNSKIH